MAVIIMHIIYIHLLSDTHFQMKHSFVKVTKRHLFYIHRPRLLWAEFDMGRVVPDPAEVAKGTSLVFE